MSKLSRRDFLKTSAAVVAGTTLAGASRILSAAHSQASSAPNILILVFDAMSARNLSLYGYARENTPNLQKFAERASVYHRHHSAGNFTTTGTASMLTGLDPWTHRALNYRGMIDRHLIDRSLFKLVGNEYKRLAFTQNLWADILLSQFEADLDVHPPCDLFSRFVRSFVQPDDLPRDRRMGYYVFQDFFNFRTHDAEVFPGSLLLGSADLARELARDPQDLAAQYPRGLPSNYDYLYENASVLEGISQIIRKDLIQSQPYLAYFHLWSPHDPYNARRDFIGVFKDDLDLQAKPRHPLAGSNESAKELAKQRREYDEFIADLDHEFGRLLADLEASGLMQNSYVIVTSDHGELFERGEAGHATALMYAPLTHIPLLIAAPGQRSRSDYHTLTSNTDLMPTILHILQKEIPSWIEGKLLPGFGGIEDVDRSIFPMMAKDNPAFQPIRRATFSLIRGPYELFFFTGYPGHEDWFELYHLLEDPQELQDLFSKDITTASHMKNELLEAIHAANRNQQTN